MPRTTARQLAAVPSRPRIIGRYIRVSAVMGREDEAFRSPDLQLREIDREIARTRAAGEPVVEGPIYRDIDRSGLDFHREGIQQALSDKRAGSIDGLATYDVSRLGRTVAETLLAITELREDGGMFVSSRERIDPTPEGEVMLIQFLTWAQYQANRIAAGWRAVIEARGEAGLHNGTPPLGYGTEKDDKGRTRIVVDAVKAPAVVEAFHRYDAGESATSIWRDLYERGVLRTQDIRRTLANPFYVGDIRLHAHTGAARKRKRLSGVEPFRTRGQHMPLLVTETGEPDYELFERVQARLAREAKTARRYIEPVHALGGLIKCPSCGRSLVYDKGRRGQPYYRCLNGRKVGRPGVGSPTVAEVETEVLEEVRRVLVGMKQEDSATAAAISKRAAAIADRDRLAAKIATKEGQLTDADLDLYDGKLSPERHGWLVERIEGQLAELRSAVDACEPVTDGPTVAEAVDAATDLLRTWTTATPAERAAKLRAAGVVRVTVAKAETYRQPVAGRVITEFSI